MKDVIIVGGGLAGLVNAILLARAGLQVLVIEKKQYPFHKVCGEYVSNEVLPFLHSLGIYPEKLGASSISRLQVSSPSGKSVLEMPLDLGGFGISRYALDYHLWQVGLESGAEFLLGKTAEKIDYAGHFQLQLSDGTVLESSLVIGAFGKRSKLDKQLNRDFITKRSPYVGVKYHLQTDFSKDLIALHNFRDGYCGVCAIENDTINLCYLTSRNNIKKYGSIEEMEQQILYKNPFMQRIRQNAVFLYEKPEVINEISFEPKRAVEHHILMSGDTAGLITPLCGNGMAMAIHSAKILSGLIVAYFNEQWTREKLETQYQQQWQQTFARRLWVGRQTQRLFGSAWVSSMAIGLLKRVKPAARLLVKHTHGETF